jgi:alcohol dehydrogenase class IV
MASSSPLRLFTHLQGKLHYTSPNISINDPELNLSADIKIPSSLVKLGVKEEDLQIMAENAMKDACGFTNPPTPSLDNVIQIFKNAL